MGNISQRKRRSLRSIIWKIKKVLLFYSSFDKTSRKNILPAGFFIFIKDSKNLGLSDRIFIYPNLFFSFF